MSALATLPRASKLCERHNNSAEERLRACREIRYDPAVVHPPVINRSRDWDLPT